MGVLFIELHEVLLDSPALDRKSQPNKYSCFLFLHV
nr:MAG TPA: hypothetical protein [Caudoviricetes sp.]